MPKDIANITTKDLGYMATRYIKNQRKKKQFLNIVKFQVATIKAIKNNWNLTEYNRLHKFPETAINLVFFGRVLGLGQDWFYTKLS